MAYRYKKLVANGNWQRIDPGLLITASVRQDLLDSRKPGEPREFQAFGHDLAAVLKPKDSIGE